MAYTFLKVLLSAIVIVAVSEAAKRSTFIGALIASLPLTSLLAFVWLYAETGDIAKISTLSTEIFWLVIPSLVLFLLLPLFIKSGVGFWLSLVLACAGTAASYFAMARLLRYAGVQG
ncbi:MAG TPA: DUF3147 family protein [Pyrinomonadaceae bacterium]|nr:DUF3147 family protein [Pyrinomonadaceae bacterium]